MSDSSRVCARPGCGQPIPPDRGDRALYCSRSCQQRRAFPARLSTEPLAPVAPLPEERLINRLRRGPGTLAELAADLAVSPGQVLDGVLALQDRGVNVQNCDNQWTLERTPKSNAQTGRTFDYVSRPDNHFVFGGIGDSHLGSLYERLDCLEDLYDRFVAGGADRVFHCGNYIDGETDFNKWDLHVRGLEPQARYLAAKHPQRDGLHTYAVTGEDHEGWYCRREAIDVGPFVEHVMREEGRDDWHDLGFMEATVDLVNANTGQRSSLLVIHPGGGSAYALSYKPQKILESLEGGEKPGVVLIGHYHKLSANLIRNVWAIQVGCTEDQTPFMRKKSLEAHVGGVLIDLEQDPATGAIVSCTPTLIRYFNKSYYNGRWGKVGPVVLPERVA